VTARAAPLKGRERTEQKIRDKYAGDPNRVTDVARGGVDAPTPEAAEEFVAILARRYRVLDQGWNVVEGGYFDRKLTVVFDDGQLGEVRLWAPGMFEVKEARGHKLYGVYRDLSRSSSERMQALADMEALYAGVMDKLPPQWRSIFGQETPGMEAPSRATTETNVSSDTSGEPSSARTSGGDMSDQVPSEPSSSMAPGSGSSAGMERSTRKNRMGDTSRADISDNGRTVKTERTSAGEQSLFDGIEPITERTRLDQRMSQPMGRGGGAADALGLEPEAITIRHGDTGTCPEGIGALASRATAIGGSAVWEVCAKAAARRMAGENGEIVEELRYETGGQAWGYGAALAVLSVDRETGAPRLERLDCVDDTGRAINPRLVEGQILGGLAQGLGEALLEHVEIDAEGQVLTGSYMDYAMPRAGDMPPVRLYTMETPSPLNTLGAKGVGEAGTISAPPAILLAALDALAPLGVRDLTMPLTPCKLWSAINEAEGAAP